MKRAVFTIPMLLAIVAIVLFGCGKVPGVHNSGGPSTSPGTVLMDPTNFVTKAVTIKAGTAVHFSDTGGGGGLHVICLGKDLVCDKTAKGPQDVMGDGFTINPGETKDVVFPTAGTYQITCSVHQNMNLVVTVQ